ncbi:MAG: hypothetical protein E7Z87_01620 [Cyanobacteria bacterium SIG26]|nr:hypothetical protein [Cyanobacteria bacterium SIG26]
MINCVGGLGYGYGTNLSSTALERQRRNEFKPIFTGTEYAKEEGRTRNTKVALGTVATLGTVAAAIIFRKPIANALGKIPGLKTIGSKLGEWGSKAWTKVAELGTKAIDWAKNLIKK